MKKEALKEYKELTSLKYEELQLISLFFNLLSQSQEVSELLEVIAFK